MNKKLSFTGPLKYFVLFICFTLCFSFWGPKVYVDYNKIAVFFYMMAFLLFFSFGYFRGISVKYFTKKKLISRDVYQGTIPFLNACIFLAAATALVSFFIILASGKLSLSLSSVGQNYMDFYSEHNANKGTYSFQTILLFLMGFPKLVTLVLGLYFFERLDRGYKYAVISVFLLTIVNNTISAGNQKSLGDIVIYIIVILAVKSLDYSSEQKRRLFYKIFGVVIFFVIILSVIQLQRLEAVGLSSYDINDQMSSRTHFDFNHPFFQLFGTKLGLGLANFITGYLSGGYYGLSLCFKLDFVWTYGIGNSFSLMMFFEQFFGVSTLNSTYLMRMQDTFGWNGLMAWNTIFPWFASDLTFFGALVLFIPIGYIYAVSWKEVVMYRNPISLLMFSMLTIGLVFVPANNQLLHGVDGFITTFIVFVIWGTQHQKYNVVARFNHFQNVQYSKET